MHSSQEARCHLHTKVIPPIKFTVVNVPNRGAHAHKLLPFTLSYFQFFNFILF